MNKNKKTREQKIRASERKRTQEGFQVNPAWIVKNDKLAAKEARLDESELKFFKLDLTKTFVLTMLVVALELALWQWLARR